MFRLLILLLCAALVPFAGTAEAALSFTDDLTALYTWPEGAPEAEASYVYRSTYPQIAGDSALAMTINNIYQYEVSYALDFDCPMNGSSHDPSEGQMQVNTGYEMTHLSSEYLSIRISKELTVGESSVRVITAHTFPLTGDRAGTVTALPYLLGVIKPDADEWLIERQTAKVDACARNMVWFLVERAMNQDGSAIYPDMTQEEFEWCFYPEEDFYLDEACNFVFFIQEGIIAPAEAGPFFFSITLDEMLDEL